MNHWLQRKSWQTPVGLLVLMSMAMPLAFASWQTLLNNFVVNEAGFNGADIGILQSLREVPGFLAFTAVFVLLVIREQRFALISLALLGLGVALTGWFPSVIGLYCTTVLMSVGFHYFETVKTSLSLQWLGHGEAPRILGQLIAVGSFSSLFVYCAIWVMSEWLQLGYASMYMVGGGLALLIVLFCATAFPDFPQPHTQHKHLVLRQRYWLYYALTFMSGARRQIFVVFAGFMMVEKFDYGVGEIALLFIINHLFNLFFAARIGGLIGRIGERRALVIEYVGLIAVFAGYAFVEVAWLAGTLYVVDHLFFALAIAIKTYFQKIADPADIASTAGVAFTINHIAAVVIPALFGIIWLSSPSSVFLIGAAMAFVSLLLACNVPQHPEPSRIAVMGNATPAP
ncbi:MFS transporter [Aestuariirhabdus sp. Z084]|uniref:MFS transporter n=1 Tax=Aestuariirhabdus haliotis TaxID=2918751 RepID=UPI00201B45D0|nr:MFS transporter [Aestuariirhabdus haliotis]MCL6414609.1 MFS transporter [Aestuariirhabdus haliotis]MCL6418409.1 MFS transporter [Aestuariirhabdus haliotis]